MSIAELPASYAPIEGAPPAPLSRPRVVVVATTFAAAGCLVFFLALIGIYLTLRSSTIASSHTWIPEGATIPLQQPNIMLFALLMSSVTIQWAVDAIKKDDRVHAYLALGITGLFGFAVLNMAAYLYSVMKLDIAGASPMAVLTYTITGAHIFMLVVALVFAALMAFRAFGGQFNARQHDGISAAALFWHAQTVVFGLIWYAIYITK
jgi:heme/copper-type cytochrome/quinol oxidase subunit 3